MRIIHSNGFQEDERVHIRAVIYSNLLIAFRALVQIMIDNGSNFQNPENEAYVDVLLDTPTNVDADQAFGDEKAKIAMLSMWHDAGVQEAVKKGHEYALNDNLAFYIQNLDRMFTPGWIPGDPEMLYARSKTTGITETFFDMGHLVLRMMDVGGQRSERKKWLHCFEGVQCLLFTAALSGYDQCLIEDQTVNQMNEALVLFESLANGEWFKNKPIILFLNKIDLFKAKLRISSVKQRFPDYQGRDDDEEAAQEYFANRFRVLNRTADREIDIHFTNATDTNLLKTTMQSVQDVILQNNLNNLVST